MVRLEECGGAIVRVPTKEFQFLYGTIRGLYLRGTAITSLPFQFLYGTIRGIHIMGHLYLINLFQFLYGTIRGCPNK